MKQNHVIGNFPWFSIERVLDDKKRKDLVKTYRVSGKSDISSCFLIDIINKAPIGTKIIEILPLKTLYNDSEETVREKIFKECTIISVDKLPKEAFPGIDMNSCILYLIKGRSEDSNISNIFGKEIKQSDLNGSFTLSFLNQNFIDLGEMFDARRGEEISSKDPSISETCDNHHKRKFVLNKDFNKFRIKRVRYFDPSYKETNYCNSLYKNIYDDVKIIVQNVSENVISFLDTQSLIVNKQTICALPKKALKIEYLKMIVCILNSKFMTSFVNENIRELKSSHTSFTMKQFKKIPIPKKESVHPEVLNKFVEIHDSFVSENFNSETEIELEDLIKELYEN